MAPIRLTAKGHASGARPRWYIHIMGHWDDVYARKAATEVSWFRPHLDVSLGLIAASGLPSTAHIVDVGAGASTLVDDLLERGFAHLTAVDIAGAALEQTRARLGNRSSAVRWLVGDVTTPLLDEASVDLWHDRAVFHFLAGDAREAYVREVRRCVRPGGFGVLGTFAPDGPEKCSGLPVTRYGPDELVAVLGPAFEEVTRAHELHTTPWGSPQPFTYVLCRRRSASA